MKKSTKNNNKTAWCILLAVVIVGSYVLTGLLWHSQRSQINSLSKQLQTLADNQSATSGGSYSAVTIAPSEKAVYLPLAKLKLSATTLNQGLVYGYSAEHTMDGSSKVFPAEVSVSTHNLAVNDYSSTRQFDCSQVAYADFVTPSYPVNPMWKSNGSVKLQDGRTMNVYYAPSIPGCDAAWKMSDIDSKAIADSLKQAVSY